MNKYVIAGLIILAFVYLFPYMSLGTPGMTLGQWQTINYDGNDMRIGVKVTMSSGWGTGSMGLLRDPSTDRTGLSLDDCEEIGFHKSGTPSQGYYCAYDRAVMQKYDYSSEVYCTSPSGVVSSSPLPLSFDGNWIEWNIDGSGKDCVGNLVVHVKDKVISQPSSSSSSTGSGVEPVVDVPATILPVSNWFDDLVNRILDFFRGLFG